MTHFLSNLCTIYLLVGALGSGTRLPGAPLEAKGRNKLTTLGVITGFGGQPTQLTEVSPGFFVGLGGAGAYTLTSAGAITNLAQVQASQVVSLRALQAPNGLFYGLAYNQKSCGFAGACYFNFSFDLGGGIQYYTPSLMAIQPSAALANGSIIGSDYAPTVLRIALDGTPTPLHTLPSGTFAEQPIVDREGVIYGIAQAQFTEASVFRLTHKGDFKILKTYNDGGKNPTNEYLVLAHDGMLYGTAGQGGEHANGGIFRISPDGTGYKVRYSFPRMVFGRPGFLTEGSDGNLYGAALGIINGGTSSLFRISPAGKFETLQTLNGITQGHCPCYLTEGSDGKFYGTVAIGGPGGGIAFVWDVGMPKPKPQLGGVYPNQASVGTSVTVYGENLLGATAVAFNGVSATINSVMGRFVSVTVPAGATTGHVTVATPNGTSTSPNPFTVE